MQNATISSGEKIEEAMTEAMILTAANWAYEAVSVLSDKKIVNGKSETLFYPNDYVTREEFVKMLAGALELPLNSENNTGFGDVDTNAWYAQYVYAACHSGVCRGISETEFDIGKNIKRQDAAVMVYNAIGQKTVTADAVKFDDSEIISDYAKTAVMNLSSMGVINGKGNNCFEPLNTLTRAEAAQIIYKAFFAD